MVMVVSLLEVFLQFYMLDMKKDTLFLHITPINGGGNKSFVFVNYKDSWVEWNDYFFQTLREPK